jgi:hypothetical protein
MVDASSVHLSIEQIALGVAGILVAVGVLVILLGVILLRRAPRQPFFLARQQTAAAGWRLLFVALFVLFLAALVRWAGAPVALQIITPTPSITFTPSITLTPSITFTPTQTVSPTITLTPTQTRIPSATLIPTLPPSVLHDFSSNVLPSPDLRFLSLVFTTTYNSDLQPLQKSKVFFNPVQRIAGIFIYQGLNLGVQFTSVWLRNGDLVYWKTDPWNGDPNGTSLVQWDLTPGFYTPGAYEVRIYVGTQWFISGEFNIVGPMPTATITPLPTDTRIPVVIPSETPSHTPFPSLTSTPEP